MDGAVDITSRGRKEATVKLADAGSGFVVTTYVTTPKKGSKPYDYQYEDKTYACASMLDVTKILQKLFGVGASLKDSMKEVMLNGRKG